MKLKFIILNLLLLAGALCAATPEYFVFDNGVGRGNWTPEAQAKTLKELGYTGITYRYTNPEDLARWQKECRKQKVKINALYVYTYLDRTNKFDPGFKDAIKLLKGTDTVIWMTVMKPKTKGDHDAEAVSNVQEVADLAAAQGLRVALYGHFGFYVETGLDSARIVKLANRPNVGATINLCHEFLSGHGNELEETLRVVAPLATMVSINGVDLANTNYIVRLDQGDFDLTAYLKKLSAAGYHGPVVLQCYNVKGDTLENLTANIATWRRIKGELADQSPSAPPQNTLSAKETASGWKLLFDGKTTDGWRGFQKAAFPDKGWVVENGCLKCLGQKGGDIVTTSTFTNFEVSWEWRLSFRANSGLKYFVDEKRADAAGKIYSTAIAHEYQTIDDKNFIAEPLNEKKLTGAWYDVVPPKNAKPRPLGEFNQSRLVVRGNKVEHRLNGKRVVNYKTDGAESASKIANSKFKDVPGFADKIPTPILLQDHNTVVWFRNIKLRELK
ncbi:MAG: family 16 glycoside hydrolase [Verrucomicrobiota bacterium]